MQSTSTDGDKHGQRHRVFLIRHGETVDNVAGLYAGSRDSALTNHGVNQASRLGSYLAENGVCFTHIFSSDLSRAFKTAEAVRVQQTTGSAALSDLSTVQCAELREQDFGSYEGRSFYHYGPHLERERKQNATDDPRDMPGFQDMESKDAMTARADSFFTKYLSPILRGAKQGKEVVIAVVSHGMLLSTLWRCILRRQPPDSVALNPELLETMRPISLEHLGGWGNTSYLELTLQDLPPKAPLSAPEADGVVLATSSPAVEDDIAAEQSAPVGTRLQHETPSQDARLTYSHSTFFITIQVINSREHLKGLKRTGGGVGTSKFDESQTSIKSFFKTKD